MTEPASIRYKNPGAMWGSPLAKKWGAAKAIVLHDGKGQGNNIAVFPTYVTGICAQLDLWRTSKNYKNKKFCDAIRIWSGGNSVESYISFVLKRVPGMTRNTRMDDDFWRGPMGIAFLKAQAWHEAGKKYPAPDADWVKAQRLVFGEPVEQPPLMDHELPPQPPPPDIEPPQAEPDDTKPHAAPAAAPKTGVTEGAKAVGGLGIIGFLQLVWENIKQAPDTILQAIVAASKNPSFWIFAAIVVGAAYIWWRRSNMKKAIP